MAVTGHPPPSCPSRDRWYQGWVSHGLQKHLKAWEETRIGSFLGFAEGRKKEKNYGERLGRKKIRYEKRTLPAGSKTSGMLEGRRSWNWPRRCLVPPRWLEPDTRPGSEALPELAAQTLQGIRLQFPGRAT